MKVYCVKLKSLCINYVGNNIELLVFIRAMERSRRISTSYLGWYKNHTTWGYFCSNFELSLGLVLIVFQQFRKFIIITSKTESSKLLLFSTNLHKSQQKLALFSCFISFWYHFNEFKNFFWISKMKFIFLTCTVSDACA